MLADVLREIDTREIFEWNEGRLPFLLLDGHGSRTEFEVAENENDPTPEWETCIGVSYRTSL